MPIFFRQKNTKPNRKYKKTAQNTFVQKAGCKMLVKLTPTYYNSDSEKIKLLHWVWFCLYTTCMWTIVLSSIVFLLAKLVSSEKNWWCLFTKLNRWHCMYYIVHSISWTGLNLRKIILGHWAVVEEIGLCPKSNHQVWSYSHKIVSIRSRP